MNETHLKLLRECVDAGEQANREWRKVAHSSLMAGASWHIESGTAREPSLIEAWDERDQEFCLSAANARESLKALLAEYEAMQVEIARLRDTLEFYQTKEQSNGK